MTYEKSRVPVSWWKYKQQAPPPLPPLLFFFLCRYLHAIILKTISRQKPHTSLFLFPKPRNLFSPRCKQFETVPQRLRSIWGFIPLVPTFFSALKFCRIGCQNVCQQCSPCPIWRWTDFLTELSSCSFYFRYWNLFEVCLPWSSIIILKFLFYSNRRI